jgi:hypothetical protein
MTDIAVIICCVTHAVEAECLNRQVYSFILNMAAAMTVRGLERI